MMRNATRGWWCVLLAGACAVVARAQQPASNEARVRCGDAQIAAQPRVRVLATGQAPRELPNAREAAIESALRRAVEAGAGVAIESISQTEDMVLVRDTIVARTNGYVDGYDVLEENPDQDGFYTVRVQATVRRGEFCDDLASLRALMQRKGRPTVLVVGSRDGASLPPEDVEALLQQALGRKGLRLIDGGALEEVQRREAREALTDERNTRKAAQVASAVGAHVLAVVQARTEAAQAQEAYGISSQRVLASATVRLIDPATGTLFAIETIEGDGSGETEAIARREALRRTLGPAADAAVAQIARRWLSDVDARGGAEVTLAVHGAPFERVGALVAALRKVQGVKEVLVDNTDPKGVSTLRVVTNSSAADVASVLQRLDAKVRIRSTTPTRIDLDL